MCNNYEKLVLGYSVVIRFFDTDYMDYVDLLTTIHITPTMSDEDILFHAAASREIDHSRVSCVHFVQDTGTYINYLRYIPNVVASLV